MGKMPEIEGAMSFTFSMLPIVTDDTLYIFDKQILEEQKKELINEVSSRTISNNTVSVDQSIMSSSINEKLELQSEQIESQNE